MLGLLLTYNGRKHGSRETAMLSGSKPASPSARRPRRTAIRGCRSHPRRVQGRRESCWRTGRAAPLWRAEGMNAPLYTTEILRLAASLPSRARWTARTGVRSSLADLRKPDRDGGPARRGGGRAIVAAGPRLRVRPGVGGAGRAARRAAGRTTRSRRRCTSSAAGWPATDEPCLARPRRPRARAVAQGRHGAILLPFRALLAAIEAAR